MTLQIDSLAISTDEAQTHELEIDQLHEQVATLDADILSAIEHRTELVRRLAAATDNAAITTPSTTFDDLGSDGSAFSRMLARIASATR
ncbi:hypothetical protein QMK17_22480 [Rhodococcus sp. G-MC3]|uniref:hypothetical protein n=1 Tax=Rhodococcus sp. G-MC3 TaxID=3046209 RepID=UPI0024B9AC87|nr:hypothetical protein [Rhodococcus sp. G-MC3]MDJ0396094.1 hypothetical protein [Rhodococcus sp. G-MC3]